MAGNVHRAPFAPRVGYMIPCVSLVVSLVSLATLTSLGGVAVYHALTGRQLATPPVLIPPVMFAAGVCFVTLGPMLSVLLCLAQRAHAQQTYGSDMFLGYRMKRMNTVALYCGALAVAAAMVGLLTLSGAA